MTVVTVEQRGPVLVIAINWPEKLNAINKAVAVELQHAFADFDRSEQRVAILTDGGQAILGNSRIASIQRSGHRPAQFGNFSDGQTWKPDLQT
jgi:enoyl-CoA hydratase/carnithine racemase